MAKLATVSRSLGAFLAIVMLAACGQRADENADGARHYQARGVIRGFAPDRRALDVEHEDISGFMPSMTMTIAVRDRKQLAGFVLGDAISFRLTVTDRDSWIDQVRKISADKVHLPASTAISANTSNISASHRLRDGDALPSFSLTNQNGEPISADTFRGRPLVLTFIFTRCALPNFCPRMSQNFSALQEAHAGARLLSITLDPAFDTPPVLKQYSEYLHADPAVWNFATGDASEIDRITQAFSVYREVEGGTLSHGLATALIDSQGKIVQIWRGNSWKTAEVIDAIKALGN
ncbi:MAG: SCO family protein [Chthoniobacterales bacterium]